MDAIEIEQRIRRDLADAMRRRDRAEVKALRSLLGAIGNAGAVPPPPDADRTAVIGAGPAGPREAPRRHLDAAAVREVVEAEIEERRAAIETMERVGATEAGDRLRTEVDVLSRYLTTGSAPD